MTNPQRQPLTRSEIKTALAKLPGWSFGKNKLTKQFQFKTFRDAMAFIVRLAFEAEALNHHPELMNVYNRVTIALNTHDADGKVTAMDVALAGQIEKAFQAKN
jgi:4a-hydroxytetrahydrobiopterin dehydratase